MAMQLMEKFAAEHKMHYKNIIFNSLKESFLLIWKNKALFVLLFILQIIFFIIFFYINLTYQTKIIQSSNEIFEYLSKQKLDELSVTDNLLQQKNILGDDPLLISRNFNEILKNFRLYLVYIFILLIIFMSINWTITNKVVYKVNFKKLINIFFKNLLVLLFYLGLIFLFFFSLLNIPLSELASVTSQLLTKYVPFLIFLIILLYFMFVSIALLYKIELKKIVQKTLVIGIKKIHYIAAVYFINLFFFTISIFLFYYFIEKNLFILLLSIILMIFSFVFGRVFVINIVDRLERS